MALTSTCLPPDEDEYCDCGREWPGEGWTCAHPSCGTIACENCNDDWVQCARCGADWCSLEHAGDGGEVPACRGCDKLLCSDCKWIYGDLCGRCLPASLRATAEITREMVTGMGGAR